ncbi:MAG: hypothetical protein LBL37_09240, partial [Gracilibacteraceae bacterium]|nr:hypothetical protein [Gracilibacteraceae bacterium]
AHVPITRVDTASEALAASMGEKARVDLTYMSELTGMSEETLKTELEGVIFLNVGGAESQDKAYVTADEYLSDNIREKLTLHWFLYCFLPMKTVCDSPHRAL